MNGMLPAAAISAALLATLRSTAGTLLGGASIHICHDPPVSDINCCKLMLKSYADRLHQHINICKVLFAV